MSTKTVLTAQQRINRVITAQQAYFKWKRRGWYALALSFIVLASGAITDGLSDADWAVAASVVVVLILYGAGCFCLFQTGSLLNLGEADISAYVSHLLAEPVTAYKTRTGKWGIRHSSLLRIETVPTLQRFNIYQGKRRYVCSPMILRDLLNGLMLKQIFVAEIDTVV